MDSWCWIAFDQAHSDLTIGHRPHALETTWSHGRRAPGALKAAAPAMASNHNTCTMAYNSIFM